MENGRRDRMRVVRRQKRRREGSPEALPRRFYRVRGLGLVAYLEGRLEGCGPTKAQRLVAALPYLCEFDLPEAVKWLERDPEIPGLQPWMVRGAAIAIRELIARRKSLKTITRESIDR